MSYSRKQEKDYTSEVKELTQQVEATAKVSSINGPELTTGG